MHGAILQTGRVTLKALQYVGFWSESTHKNVGRGWA